MRSAGGGTIGTAVVHEVGFRGDDTALVAALITGHPGAPAALFDRYGPHLQRVLASVMGVDPELPDLLHEVFSRALAEITRLREPDQLRAWLTSIAVYTARGLIRRRQRGRWLIFRGGDTLPVVPDGPAPFEARESLRATYALLECLTIEERLVFSLRYIRGMELREVAEASGHSLATTKRRLARAEKRFCALARRDPVLAAHLERSERWRER
jgi:RNA polymerase sigma-70 factor (ECF subfamily)